MHNYPEQNDIIVTNVLSLFGLDKDGNDSNVNKRSDDTISEDAKEKLRYVELYKGSSYTAMANLSECLPAVSGPLCPACCYSQTATVFSRQCTPPSVNVKAE